MLQKLKIAKEKSKLKLNLLKHANSNLETRNNPELLRAVAELLKEISRWIRYKKFQHLQY